MVKHFNLTMTPSMASQPIIANLCKNTGSILTIESAQISEKGGWLRVSLSGDRDDIQRGIADLYGYGVLVSPVHLAALTDGDNALP